MKKDLYRKDQIRYGNGTMPPFQKWFRRCQYNSGIKKIICKCIYYHYCKKIGIEIHYSTQIEGGCYFGHPWGININEKTVIGKNCNIHKGVTIGRENRGKREGVPSLGNDVWIGINSTIVGAIKIGDDVLIAPNSFVNCDIPSHSIVIGNPCIVKPCNNATEKYINNRA